MAAPTQGIPKQLAHVALRVRDLDRAVDFYTNVVGLKLKNRRGNGAFLGVREDLSHELALFPLPETAARPFAVTSACGVCGKGQLEELRATPAARPGPGPHLHPELIHRLPAALRAGQATFDATGGLHAAGLFDAGGERLLVREDVGRHNAVDKLIGARFLAGQLPASDTVLVVSGRASFELVQKALMAQIPVLAAVGAPSTLAVSLAAEGGMTLLGFVRDQRFNIYCGRERVQMDRVSEDKVRRATPPPALGACQSCNHCEPHGGKSGHG